MFERFSEQARGIVVFAQEAALELRHNYIGTEHILLALLRETDAVPARVLAGLGIDAAAVRDQVAQIVGMGDAARTGQIPFTPRAKKVLELALREALALGHNYIGPEHILLGLVRENEGVAARILYASGLTACAVAQATFDELGMPGDRASTYPDEAPKRTSTGYVVAPPERWTSWAVGDWAIPMALGALLLGLGILVGWLTWG